MGDINVGVGMATGLGAVTRSGGFKITGGTDWEENGIFLCLRDSGGGGGGGGGGGVNLITLAGDPAFGFEPFEILAGDSWAFSKGLCGEDKDDHEGDLECF